MMNSFLPLFRVYIRPGLLIFAFVAAMAPSVSAQYFTENFDDISSLWTSGWAQQNRSTTQGQVPNWFQGDPGIFAAFDGGDTAYIGVNYNCVTGSNTISNWLFTPTRTLTNGEKISFWTRTVDTPNYPDRLQVRLSLNGSSTNVGTTASSVGDFTTLLLQVNPTLTTTGYPNAWRQYTIIVSGLSAPTAGRFGLRYYVTSGGPSGSNSEYIGIDSFAYYLPPAGDLEMQAIRRMEYTVMPERHPFAGPFVGRLKNQGSTTVTNARMEVHLYDGAGTQVYTASSAPVASTVPGAVDTVTVPAPAALAPDNYTLQYIALHSAADGNHANDTLYDHFAIAPLQYARDNGTVIGSIGISSNVGGYVGQMFHFNQPDNLDSIWVHVTKGYTGLPIAAVVWDMAAGLPQQIVGTTDTLLYTTDSAATYVLPMHSGHQQLPAGDFVVTMIEFDSTLHVGLSDAVFTAGTTWLSWPTLPNRDWANVEFFGLPQYNHAQMIRPILSACDLTIATSATLETSPGANDGTAAVVATGGTPPYTYLWSTGATTASITGLGIDPVTVTVTDAAGCASIGTQSLVVGVAAPLPAFDYSIHPNPNDGRFQVDLNLAEADDVTLSVIDMMGQVVSRSFHPAVTRMRHDVDVRGMVGGIYVVQLELAGGGVYCLRVIVRGEL